ncbi:hypothetical protein E05_26780 [Plautia stali symbiont]|nr:hypothetical protein E05_26780 [Plautia stali symbiont]
MNVAVNASGLIALNGQIPAKVQLAKGARTTLAIPLKAQDGFGEGDVQVTVSGLSLPNETLAPSVHRWKIGVRPAYPAQTLSFDNVMHSGQRWQVMASAFNGLQASNAERPAVAESSATAEYRQLHQPALRLSLWLSGADRQRHLAFTLHQSRTAQRDGHQNQQR